MNKLLTNNNFILQIGKLLIIIRLAQILSAPLRLFSNKTVHKNT